MEYRPLLKSTRSAPELRIADERILSNAKWLYFTLNMALYSSLTFTSAYFYVHWHVPIYQFGCLSALSIVELVGAVWWGSLADRTGRHRLILIVCTAVYCALFCGLPLGGWLLPGEDSAMIKLLISALLLGGTFFFMSAFFPLVDSCVLSALKRRVPSSDTHSHFGRQRLWGTLGHGAVSLLSGQAISACGWLGMFAVLIGTCLSFIISTRLILTDCKSSGSGPKLHESDGIADGWEGDVIIGSGSCSISDEIDEKGAPGCSSITTINDTDKEEIVGSNVIYENAASLLRPTTDSSASSSSVFNAKFLWLLAVVLVAGWMRSVLSTFLPYHLLFDLHQSPLFVGLTAIFRISAETILFAGWQRPGGFNEFWLLRVGLFASVLRVAGYVVLAKISVLIPLWLAVFLLESLKGVSVACIVSGAVRLAHSLVPEPQSTRAQAYVSGTYSGLATAVAGVAGGAMVWLEAEHSISMMFAWTALIGGVFFLLAELKGFEKT